VLGRGRAAGPRAALAGELELVRQRRVAEQYAVEPGVIGERADQREPSASR
jgi:hypothetical protein